MKETSCNAPGHSDPDLNFKGRPRTSGGLTAEQGGGNSDGLGTSGHGVILLIGANASQ
jgi:hypothetical protein